MTVEIGVGAAQFDDIDPNVGELLGEPHREGLNPSEFGCDTIWLTARRRRHRQFRADLGRSRAPGADTGIFRKWPISRVERLPSR